MPRGIPNKKAADNNPVAKKGEELKETEVGKVQDTETMSSNPDEQPDLHLQGHRRDIKPDTDDLHLQRNNSTELQKAQEQAAFQVSHRIDTSELDTSKKKTVDDGRGVIDRSAINDEPLDIVGAAGAGEYARELAFFEELVEVEVHESTDPNAEPIVDLYCNGVSQRFIRGVPQVVKRKYVQILATAKPQTISTKTAVEGDNVVNRITRHAALRYPFRVIRDDNPKGADWLRQTLLNG